VIREHWKAFGSAVLLALVVGALGARLFYSQQVAELQAHVGLLSTPRGHHDTTALEGRLRTVGFKAVTAEEVAKTSVAPSALSAAIGFCQGTDCGASSMRTGKGSGAV
jgi:hypothetical protein